MNYGIETPQKNYKSRTLRAVKMAESSRHLQQQYPPYYVLLPFILRYSECSKTMPQGIKTDVYPLSVASLQSVSWDGVLRRDQLL